jgi:hypothetical protein
MELDHEAAYIPLGLWSLTVFSFWFISNLSIMYWYNWSVSTWGPEPYVISEILLIFIIIYVLWHPQMNFDWGLESVVTPSKKPGIIPTGVSDYVGVIPRLKKTVSAGPRKPKKCPICGAKIVVEQRRCKNCGHDRTFTWCKISEGYIVTCPHCKAQTSYGKERCINCGSLINRNIKCICGTEHEIRDWDFLKIANN